MYNYSNLKKDQQVVALWYNQKVDVAPKILLTGKGEIAEKILEVAKDNNITIHKDEDLVRFLSILEIDTYIPVVSI